MTEVGDRYARIADGFAARLAGVRPDQWNAPTPCSEWTVRALVTHVITTHGRIIAPVSHETAPPDADPDGDLTAQWAAATNAIVIALADRARADQIVGGVFGEQTFESVVSVLLCSDTLFHTWDLARATGQDEDLDDHAAARALELLGPLDAAIRRPGGFAAKIIPPSGADVQTRLLNFGGRAVG